MGVISRAYALRYAYNVLRNFWNLNMPQSYLSTFYHIVFGTRDGRPALTPQIRTELYPYIGGIIRNEIGTPIKVNGVADHVHVLLEGKSTVAIAKMAQLIKTNSSKWLNETREWNRKFEWQEGYGGFTVSLKAVPTVRGYIENQEDHHRHITWTEEWREMLDRHDSFVKRMNIRPEE